MPTFPVDLGRDLGDVTVIGFTGVTSLVFLIVAVQPVLSLAWSSRSAQLRHRLPPSG
ncbi:MAG TPA: hypothetical protein VGH11_10190 [Jatrophihabitans sp.]